MSNIIAEIEAEQMKQKIPAFDAGDIARYKIIDTRDISRSTPGLVIENGSGGKGNMQAYSRGVGVMDTHTRGAQRIGMYLDGAYLGTGIGGIFDLVDQLVTFNPLLGFLLPGHRNAFLRILRSPPLTPTLGQVSMCVCVLLCVYVAHVCVYV